MATVARQYTPPVDAATFAAWQAAVQEIGPPSDALTWLHLSWEPGDAWEPIERLVIWQMRPRRLLLPDLARGLRGRLDLLGELEGPAPRSTGHLCAPGRCLCAIKQHAWRDGACTQIDQRQWELYHTDGPTRGCYGTRWWIVQGATGGHLRRFSNTQRRLAQMAGLPVDPPHAGALPYAPLDSRVLTQIAQYDRMRAYGLMTDFLLRSPEQLDAEERTGAEDATRQIVAWVARQMGEVLDEGGSRLQSALAAVPRPVGFKDTTDYEAEEQALLAVA